MDQEKEKTTAKKKTTTKKKTANEKEKTTIKKKATTVKKTTTKKVTPKKVEEEEKIMPYHDELSTVIERPIPYHDELSTVIEKPIPYRDDLSTIVDEKDFIEEEITPEELIDEVTEAITTPVKDLMNGEFHKKPSNWIYAICGLLLVFMVVVSIYSYLHPKEVIKSGRFIFLEEKEDNIIYDEYLEVNSRHELLHYFPNANKLGLDFDYYKYIILPVSYNPCSQSELEPVQFSINQTTIHAKFDYTSSCGGCRPSFLYYLLEVEKSLYYEDVEIDYHATNDPSCLPSVAYKPMIYFYPKKETNISVKLGNESFLTTTYPKYKNGWNYTAFPDGTLKDKTGREYYGLFWEGNHHNASVHEDGFVVKGEDALTFLEEKLRILGLTDKEANEFIIYWLPSLENNTYNYIRFETMKEINEYMPLEVQPTPDSIIRVLMDYKPLVEKIDVKEQILKSPKREGFTVVEWGGCIIKD